MREKRESESRPPAKYKMQLAEYKIQLRRMLRTSDPAVRWEDVNPSLKTTGNRAYFSYYCVKNTVKTSV